MMGKEDDHFIGRLRHSGTRVVPVFVLSLKNMPDNLILSNRCDLALVTSPRNLVFFSH
jgi:hypothetical protein